MIALTTRLNERDEAILQMQEELDAFDKIHRESELGKEQMRRRIGALEVFIGKHGLDIPEPTEEELDNTDDPAEKVRLADCETFNVTYSNLLSPEEKIKTLVQIADNRKEEIKQLKDQIRNMEADSTNLANQSRDQGSRKAGGGVDDSYQPLEDISIIATSVNEIIQKLSQQNSADVLKHVAKKLLDLQKFTTDIMSGK